MSGRDWRAERQDREALEAYGTFDTKQRTSLSWKVQHIFFEGVSVARLTF